MTSAKAVAVRQVGDSPKYHHANITNTNSETASWMTFNCVAESTAEP